MGCNMKNSWLFGVSLVACSDTQKETEPWVDGDWFDQGSYQGEFSPEIIGSNIEVLSSGKNVEVILNTSGDFYVEDGSSSCSATLPELTIKLSCVIELDDITQDTWDFSCETVEHTCTGTGSYYWNTGEQIYDATLAWDDEDCPVIIPNDFSGTGFKDGFYISGDVGWEFSLSKPCAPFPDNFTFYFGE
jgi:hypothetical protein